MTASATSPAEFDFAYVMKRYERAYVKIFAVELGAQIREAEAFGARERTLDALYSNLQFFDFADGYTALADASDAVDLINYRKVRQGAINTACATARLKDVDEEMPEFGPPPFQLAVERRLGGEAARVSAAEIDRMLWRLYRIFSQPERIEVTPRRSRQTILLVGLDGLVGALPAPERQRWLAAGWPRLTSEVSTDMLKPQGLRPELFTSSAWEQL